MALLLASGLTFTHETLAHETRPAYLEITQTDEQQYHFIFRQPRIAGRYLGLGVVSNCLMLGEMQHEAKTAALETRWDASCEAGLFASGIRVSGLERTLIDTLVLVQLLDGSITNLILTPREPMLEATGGGIPFVPAYFGLGVEHLVFGIDHLAFLLALMYLLGNLKKLVIAITSFTVAHSITLGISALGFITVPQAPVEAVIALSILVVAWEITQGSEGSMISRYPWSLTFVFGLLHGLGFAGAMAEIGLPENSALTALLLFNLGIEAGQLLVVLLVLALTWLFNEGRRRMPSADALLGLGARNYLVRAPVYLIGGLACYWLAGRTLGLLGGLLA